MNCKCERTRLNANVDQLLRSNLNFHTIEPVLHRSCSVERQQLLLLPLRISERVWNCKCERTGLHANVDANAAILIPFAPSFEFLDVCAGVTLQSISQRQQLLLLPLRISERVWNCKCEPTRLHANVDANVHQLLRF